MPCDIWDGDGNRVGTIPLSERQAEMLERGSTIIIQFRVPQLMRQALGDRGGTFALKYINGRAVVVGDQTEAVKSYIAMQADIARAGWT